MVLEKAITSAFHCQKFKCTIGQSLRFTVKSTHITADILYRPATPLTPHLPMIPSTLCVIFSYSADAIRVFNLSSFTKPSSMSRFPVKFIKYFLNSRQLET